MKIFFEHWGFGGMGGGTPGLIIKMAIAGSTIADLTCVKIVNATGDFLGACTDGTHLFVIRNNAVDQYLCDDLSLVSSITAFNGSDYFTNPVDITAYENWLYVSDRISNGQNRIVRFTKTDLAYVDEVSMDSYPAYGLGNNGINLYVARKGNLM